MLFGMCHQPSVVVNKQIKKGKWTQDVVSIIRKIRKYKIIKSSLRLDMMRLMWFWLTSWHHNIIHNKILISVLLLCSDDASGRYSAELLQYRVAQSNIPLNKRSKTPSNCTHSHWLFKTKFVSVSSEFWVGMVFIF